MSNKIQTKIQKALSFKCRGDYNCVCDLCSKQIEIMQMLEQKEKLEWMGKKRGKGMKNTISTITYEENIIFDKNKGKGNRKNESQNFDRQRNYLQCQSSYLKSFYKKNQSKAQICFPIATIAFQKSPIDNLTSLYSEQYKGQKHLLQKQQPIKQAELKLGLPFLGRSSYKEVYSTGLKSQRSQIIKPKNLIKNINLETKSLKYSTQQREKSSGYDKKFYKPATPYKRKDHLVRSNSSSFAYETLYIKNFVLRQKEKIEQNELNPEFLRKNKFGSLGKSKWMKSLNKYKANFTKQSPLQLYQ